MTTAFRFMRKRHRNDQHVYEDVSSSSENIITSSSKNPYRRKTRREQKRNPKRTDINTQRLRDESDVTQKRTDAGDDSLFNHEERILQSHLRTLIRTGRRPAGAHALSKRGAAADSPRPIKQRAARR